MRTTLQGHAHEAARHVHGGIRDDRACRLLASAPNLPVCRLRLRSRTEGESKTKPKRSEGQRWRNLQLVSATQILGMTANKDHASEDKRESAWVLFTEMLPRLHGELPSTARAQFFQIRAMFVLQTENNITFESRCALNTLGGGGV